MKILFLDDTQDRQRTFKMNRIGQNITSAWNHKEACELLEQDVYDVAYLDHDLSELAAAGSPGQFEKTGTHVAEFIAAMPEDKRPRHVIIHSWNPAGRERMQAILRDAGISCIIEPFRG